MSCGEALIDFLPAGFGRDIGYVPRPGGSPFNLAINLARHGIESAFLGAISRDALGELLMTTLRNNGIHDRYVARRPQPSTLAFANLIAFGSSEPAFFNENAALCALHPEDLPDDFGPGVKGLCFGSFSLVAEPAGGTLRGLMRREAGQRFIALDPNVRLAVQPDSAIYRACVESAANCADMIKCSRNDLAALYPDLPYEDAARGLLKRGAKLVIVTLAAEGAMLLRADGLKLHDGTEPVKTAGVGTGSSFQAAFLAFLIKHNALSRDGIMALSSDDLQSGLRYANRAAQITPGSHGAQAPLSAAV